jgi:DNA-binding CsgD family transcriptional regulator
MAARLRISVQIVKTHKANGMDKLRMKSRIDIVRYVMLQGWLQDTILMQT